jgi:hypothetical protein
VRDIWFCSNVELEMIDYRQQVLNYLQHIAMPKTNESINFASSTTCQMFWQRGLHDLNDIIRLYMHYEHIDIIFRCIILSKSNFDFGHKAFLFINLMVFIEHRCYTHARKFHLNDFILLQNSRGDQAFLGEL